MHRRSMLSWLGASAAGALSPLASGAATQHKTGGRIVAIESFCAKNEESLPELHSYLSETLQPVRSTPAMYLEALIAPQRAQVVALSSYGSFEEMLTARERIASHPDVRDGITQLASTEVLQEVQSQVLFASQGSFDLAARSSELRNGIVEVSSFSAPAWQDGPPARVMEAFQRAGIQPIEGALSAPNEHLPRYTFVIPFKSVAAELEAWSKLDADPEWSGSMKLTAKALYKLAPYSRLA